jgi:hypothetical protein
MSDEKGWKDSDSFSKKQIDLLFAETAYLSLYYNEVRENEIIYLINCDFAK